MENKLFSFPPDEHFDDQWQRFLGSIQHHEIYCDTLSLDVFGTYLEDFRDKLLNENPPYIEEANKIEDLLALNGRATRSLESI